MEEGSSQSPLESARRRLFSRSPLPTPEATPLPKMAPPKVPEHWQTPPPAPALPKKPGLSGATIFLIFALGFFALAGIIAAIVLFLGGRSVSADLLTIGVEGPTTVSGGEAVPLLITIKNDNPVAANGATMTLTFPEGTFEAGNAGKPLTHYSESLGDIPAGGTVRKTIRAAFSGEENTQLSIPITVEYRTSQSNATFVANEIYNFIISTSPVSVSIRTLSEIAAGQPLTLILSVRSNAATTLEHVAVRADYPFGFTLTNAEPQPSGDLFMIGTMRPGEEREIRIVGKLAGQEGEERVFKFTTGALRGADSREFGVAYAEHDAPVLITKPFLAVSLALNREESPITVVSAGEEITGMLSWVNALATTIDNPVITVKLDGEALDRTKIMASGGFYRSSDTTITYSSETMQGLDSLAPNSSGNGSFSFAMKNGAALGSLRNPTVSVSVSASGRRVNENNVAETLTATQTRTIKVASDLDLEVSAVRTVGPFTNTGPWPPVADTETTYTVLLRAANTVNSVANAKARMNLPSYVRFTGKVSTGAAVTFDEVTREVTWSAGDFQPGATKEAAFQIALLPSTSQKGTSPTLVSPSAISGFDRFVQDEVGSSVPLIDIRIESDPAYRHEFGKIPE